MNATRRMAGLAVLAALCLVLGGAASVYAQAAAGGAQDQGASKQPYTMAEYNSYKACADDKVPASQIKCFDDFVSKYPQSALLIYVYPAYIQSYGAQKNYVKLMENVDKLLALGDKAEQLVRVQGCYARASSYLALPAADQTTQAKGQRDATATCLGLLETVKKPEGATDDAFAASKKQYATLFNNAAAQAATLQKDYPGAVGYFQEVLKINADDPVAHYLLGKTYLAMNPAQSMDGFWHVAKAITSKSATDLQKKQLTPYLKKLILAYQGGTVCDSLSDSEYNELMQLAGSTADRPDSYKLLSSADLDAARKDMTIASVIADLKAGGDKAKVTWFASCGLEFPDVPGKLFEVTPGAAESDPVTLKLAFVTSQAEFDAATAPDMEVKIVGQPEAGKLNKDDNPAPRFTGTLMTYDPAPAFMLHWDKAKVNPEDLPKEKEKPAVKKPAPRRPAPKKPGTRSSN
jgi:tetratricopeptide (TPR) repeat protein